MEICKKILVSIIIISLLLIFIPMHDSNAVEGDVEFEEEEITYECLTLKRYPIYKDAIGGYVDLTVEGQKLADSLAGFSITLAGYGINFYETTVEFKEEQYIHGYGKVLNDGWEITSVGNATSSVQENVNWLSLMVEKKNFDLNENEVTVRIHFSLDQNVQDNLRWIGFENSDKCMATVITDKFNNTFYPFNQTGEHGKIKLGFEYLDRHAIEIKESELKNTAYLVTQKNNNLLLYDVYTKTNDIGGGLGNFEDLISKFDMNTDDVKTIDIDYTGFSHWISLRYYNNEWRLINYDPTYEKLIKQKEFIVEDAVDLKKLPVQEIMETRIGGYSGGAVFSFYIMGNILRNDNELIGEINMDDIISLRKAIIGDKNILENHSFKIECTDVNFSNDEFGTLGDIGDVISIRQRILKNEWQDIKTDK